MQTYHIWTEGCQMNVADARRVAAALEQLGYQPAARAEEAEVIVLNTCVVRQSAEDRAIGRLSSLRAIKKRKPQVVINVMGCLVGYKENSLLKERFPYVDVFSPPSDPLPLVHFLLQREGKQIDFEEKRVRDVEMYGEMTLPYSERGKQVSVFLPVVYGCSLACTYCIVPYRRGAERSRPPGEVLEEARRLAEQGVREITLLGQIVDRYGIDQPGYPSLARLLVELSKVDGIERLRFLTSHPRWMTDELLDVVASVPKVMPHIEIPVQSGDDEILQKMRRGYTADQYRQLIARIRQRIPNVAIATDLIVGFPGESEEQFQRSYTLLQELRLDVVHLARYSVRPGTLAARQMPDDVPEEEKWRRFRLVEDLQEKIAEQIHAACLGKVEQVLFENRVKGRWRGRTPTNKLVFVETEEDIGGKVLAVEIIRTGAWSMLGKLV
ncbi:MAG: tRNA (N6-isopentenyl adenosine(37)-C2)-methylthiotransferase MiaB [Anaerolineae bacterium]|nr:tRNA (N6-isopentenyl adenosine(37)-C2)-methylthiotransferase MiaB [Anaerolineae bacterium]